MAVYLVYVSYISSRNKNSLTIFCTSPELPTLKLVLGDKEYVMTLLGAVLSASVAVTVSMMLYTA